jgi:hypothetical protein
MNNWKYYLKINLPPTFDSDDAESIRNDLMSYINSKNQYGALYGPKSDKKGIKIEKIHFINNDE